MTSTRLKLILMGTGPFAVPTFDAVRAAEHEILLVVTRPLIMGKSRSGPPPTPVRDWAAKHSLPIADPESINSAEAIASLTKLQADLLIVCDYGQILKPEALAASRWGGINLHGSLLPAYRGAAPVQRAILSGDDRTGVSVIHMTPRLDGGPVLSRRETPIGTEETSGELESRLSLLGVVATLEAIELLTQHRGEPLIGKPQDPTKVSKAPRLAKTEALIDWSLSGRMIDVHVRGMQPWPIAYTNAALHPNKPPTRIAILKVRHEPDPTVSADQIGKLLQGSELAIGCKDGRVCVERLQPAGKKPMTGDEFIRGYHPAVGSRFDIKEETA